MRFSNFAKYGRSGLLLTGALLTLSFRGHALDWHQLQRDAIRDYHDAIAQTSQAQTLEADNLRAEQEDRRAKTLEVAYVELQRNADVNAAALAKLEKFVAWQKLLRVELQAEGAQKGQLLRNVAFAGIASNVQLPALANFACDTAPQLAVGSYRATITPGRVLWVAIESDPTAAIKLSTVGSEVDTRLTVYDDFCPEFAQTAAVTHDDDIGLAASYEFRHTGRFAIRKLVAIQADAHGQVQVHVTRAPGRVRGTVTLPPGISSYFYYVTAYRQNSFGYFQSVAQVSLQGTRAFELNLEEGSNYRIVAADNSVFYGNGLLGRVYPNVECANQGQSPLCPIALGAPITVTAGQSVQNIDMTFTLGASISGRIVSQDPQALLQNRRIVLYSTAGGSSVLLNSDLDFDLGRFSIRGLPAGTYKMSASAAAHRSVLYAGVVCPADCDPAAGTPMTLASEQNMAGVNFSLPRYAQIKGRITLPPNANSPSPRAFRVSDGQASGAINVDANGNYQLSVLPGSYYLTFSANGAASEIYDDVPCIGRFECSNLASGIPITIGETDVEGIDASLAPLASVQGRVVDQHGAPAASVSISLCDVSASSCPYSQQQPTNADGRFRIDNVLAGSYYIVARSTEYVDALYPNVRCQNRPNELCTPSLTNAIPVAVATSANLNLDDFVLERSAVIAGKVFGGTGFGSDIRVVRQDDATGDFAYASTLGENKYAVFDLIPGTYRLFYNSTFSGFFSQVYAGIDCVSNGTPVCQVGAGNPVTLAVGERRDDVNFDLQVRNAVTGRVLSNTGRPLIGVAVDLWLIRIPLAPDLQSSRQTDTDGRYMLYPPVPGGALDRYSVSTDVLGYRNQVHAGILCAPGTSAYLGTCSLTGGAQLAFPHSTPGVGVVNFVLAREGDFDQILATGFD